MESINSQLTALVRSTESFSNNRIHYVITFAVIAVSVFFILFSFHLRHKNDSGVINPKLKFLTVFSVLSVFYCLLILRFGLCTKSLIGFIFISILAYAGLSDLFTKTAENYLSIMIVLAGFIGADIKTVLVRLACGIAMMLFFIVISLVFRRGGLGGADIKITASCAVVIGLYRCLVSLIIGLPLGIITMVILHKTKGYDLKQSFALLPFISIGAAAAFLI